MVWCLFYEKSQMPAVTRGRAGRPADVNPKGAILNFRVHREIREAVERFARDEHRTLAAMSDLLVREAIVARLKSRKQSTDAIERLP